MPAERPRPKHAHSVCVGPSAVWIKVTVVKASYQGRMNKRMRMTGATNTPGAHLSRPSDPATG